MNGEGSPCCRVGFLLFGRNTATWYLAPALVCTTFTVPSRYILLTTVFVRVVARIGVIACWALCRVWPRVVPGPPLSCNVLFHCFYVAVYTTGAPLLDVWCDVAAHTCNECVEPANDAPPAKTKINQVPPKTYLRYMEHSPRRVETRKKGNTFAKS